MRAPSSAAAAALAFCASSPSAVVLTVWPSGASQLDQVREWVAGTGAQVVHEAAVPLNTARAELCSVLALYDGEDWLETNCWYMEQPLPAGPPDGPYAGAKWKHDLCYRNELSRHPHALVVDVRMASTSLWAAKYGIRRTLAERSGNPGNSCIHLTDAQDDAVLAAYRAGARAGGGGGMACDGSYAFTCARALLHPASLEWLSSAKLEALPLGSAEFRSAWRRYTRWLHEPPATEGGDCPPPDFLPDADA